MPITTQNSGNTSLNTQYLAPKKLQPKSDPWYTKLLNPFLNSDPWYIKAFRILFWVGAISSSAQGFFSIESFITSTAAIPGMAFLLFIPYILIIISAVIISIYSLKVEQQIFQPHFIKLIKQIFGKDEEKSVDTKTKELIAKTKALNAKNKNLKSQRSSPKPVPTKYSLAWFIYHLNQGSSSIKDMVSSFFHRVANVRNRTMQIKLISHAYVATAYVAASVIVGLRAIVSIGSAMLGIKILFGLLFTAFGVATVPTFIIPLCALMAGLGYVIKTSQNNVDQFNETLKWFGIEKYIKTDYRKAEREYKRALKGKGPSEKTNNLPIWKSALYFALNIGFIFGAVGASAQGFFSIDKFVHSLGDFFKFLNAIPTAVIFGAAAIIAIYTLIVEQRILHQYYEKLITGFISPTSYRSELINDDHYIFKILFKNSSRKVYNKDKKIEELEFTSASAYKIFSLNAKIDQLYKANRHLVGDRPLENITRQYHPEVIKQHWFKRYIYLNFARVGTVFILLLRAVTSIGPQILGLSVMMNLIASFFFGIALGPIAFPICILMAGFGYFIKCSQNLKNHYYKTMNDIFSCNIIDQDEHYTKLISSNKINDLNTEYLKLLKVDHDRRNSPTATTPSDDKIDNKPDNQSNARLRADSCHSPTAPLLTSFGRSLSSMNLLNSSPSSRTSTASPAESFSTPIVQNEGNQTNIADESVQPTNTNSGKFISIAALNY